MTDKFITLITDFGNSDGYSGILKGVISSIDPTINIIDITHNISSYSVLSASFILHTSINYFPKNTVHLVVVDPGVGSDRKPIIIKLENDTFLVGPDNGVFSHVLLDLICYKHKSNSQLFEEIQIPCPNQVETYEVDINLFGKKISNTFHGRDVFAPVAAKLFSKNHQLFESTNLKTINVLNLQKAVVRENEITGYVQYIDKFGNLVTNIPFDKAKLMSKVFIGNKEIGTVRSHYSELNASGGIFGSHGFVEIASIEKRAQHLHKASIGSPVKLITSV